MKGLAVVIEPLGDASYVGSVLVFSGFWAIFVSIIGTVIMNS